MTVITFKIPEWVPPQRIIHIVAGDYERIGYIEPNTRKVFVKTGRCSRCGKCCKKIGCKKLVFRDGFWTCDDGLMPSFCVHGTGKGIIGCTVKFEEQK